MAKLLKEANRLIGLWRDHGPNTPRLDLTKLFYEAVVPLSNGDTGKIVFKPFDSFEGLMARQAGHKEWRIGVSTNIPYEPRRHFTLAHEIGHFIGHRYERDKFECTFDNLNDFELAGFEKEANEFASTLLMPADVIRDFDKSREFGHEAISELASMFGVSREAVAYRWLRLTNRQIGFCVSRDGFFRNGRASDKLYARRVFFKGGAEIPAGSLASKLSATGQELNGIVAPPVWHETLPCVESSYSTMQAGYIYVFGF